MQRAASLSHMAAALHCMLRQQYHMRMLQAAGDEEHCLHAALMMGSNMLMSGLQAVAACAQSIQHLQEVVTKAAKKSKARKPAAGGSSSSSHKQISDGYSSGDASSSGWAHFVCPYLLRLRSDLKARAQGRTAGAIHLRDNSCGVLGC
jgi:hypothetical protein